MKFFTDCTNLDELKKAYRTAAMNNHPDHGGDEETMKQINNDYAERFEVLKTAHNATADDYHKTTETPEEFMEIVAVLLGMDGLIVELCGSWLWISGETKKHKDGLNAAGCGWSSNKKMWYWRHEEDGHRWSRRKTSMQDIRSKYGSSLLTSAPQGRRKLEETPA